MSDYTERKTRARVIFVADESDSDWLAGVNEYSEKHLHEGHTWERVETLADNPVEVTCWGFCQTCKEDGKDPEFWVYSTEIVEV